MPLSEKSRAKVEAWEWTRELDRIAIPLIPQVGVEGAYCQALEEIGGSLGRGGQDLASGRNKGSTRVAK